MADQFTDIDRHLAGSYGWPGRRPVDEDDDEVDVEGVEPAGDGDGDGDGVFVRIARLTVPVADWDEWDGDTPVMQVRSKASHRGDPEPLVGMAPADATEQELLDQLGPGDYWLVSRAPGSSRYVLRHRVVVGNRERRRWRTMRPEAAEAAPTRPADPHVIELYRAQIAEKDGRILRLEKQLEGAHGRLTAVQDAARAAIEKVRDDLEAERRGRLLDQLKAASAQAAGQQLGPDDIRGMIEDAVSAHADGSDSESFVEEMMAEMGKALQGVAMLKAASG